MVQIGETYSDQFQLDALPTQPWFM